MEQRALENSGQHCTLAPFKDLEASLPFALRGWTRTTAASSSIIIWWRSCVVRRQARPVLLTRARPYRQNDSAHVEQRNWTHVRQHFGYERYDDPAVAPLLNALCKGGLGQLLNHFLPTHKLVKKRKRAGQSSVRVYGPAQTP